MSSLQATPVHPDPSDGGGAGGNAASSPGPSSSYPWVSSVAGVSTATGNKLTEIPTVSWVVRGGLTVDLTLYHNSEVTLNSPSRGAKWSLIYDTDLKSGASGNVHMGWGNGNRYYFGYSGGIYTPPPGIHDRLVANGSPITSYDLIKKDQTDWHFAPYGSGGYFLLTSISDENGNSITVNHAANGGMLGLTDSTGRGVTFGYNSTYYTSLTGPTGLVFNFGFDGSGNLSSVTYPVINGTSYSINLGYDGSHNVTSIQDLRGNTSLLSYNADNSLAWEQDNLGNRTTFTYGYDGVRNISNALATTVTDANSHSTAYWYDSTGRLSAIYDALGNHDFYWFDGGNNLTQHQDRRGFSWNNTYDGMGNVLTAKDPYSNTTTNTYNGHNRPLTTALPSGRSTAATYDANDNLTQVQEKDAGGSVLAATTYTVSSATYGLVTDKYDPNNHHTAYAYDYNGYLSTVTTPLGHQTQATHDALGFQTSRTDALGRTTGYTPDAWERLVTTTYPDSTTNTYGYDPDGDLTAFANYAGAYTRSYDADDRLLEEDKAGSRVCGHTYDAPGQKGLLASISFSIGSPVTYAYTARNQFASVSDPGLPGLITATYAYDPDGRETGLTDLNGTTTAQAYDSAGRLTSRVNRYGSGGVVTSYGYGYDADGRITLDSEQDGSQVSYTYDGQGRLTNDTRAGNYPWFDTLTYDPAGNRTAQSDNGGSSGTLSYDADDELLAAGFTYNANGDRTGSALGGQTTIYGYDFDDRLTGLTTAAGTTAYTYDALGRQASRTAGGVTRTYEYDGGRVIGERQGGSFVSSCTYGNGLLRRDREFPLTDGQGSTRLTMDVSGSSMGGQVTSAWGRGVVRVGSGSSPYQWVGGSGYRSDGDTPGGTDGRCALVKVGCRYYDPLFGVFLTRDTELGQKPYAYCDGDPVNFSDPSGHNRFTDWWKKLWGSIVGNTSASVNVSASTGSTITRIDKQPSTYTSQQVIYPNGTIINTHQITRGGVSSSTTTIGPGINAGGKVKLGDK